MQKTLIKGGRIVTAVDDYVGDILLVDGRVDAIGRSLEVADAEVHEADGHLVIPGGGWSRCSRAYGNADG
jgi:dihydropyrimidinase